MTTDRNWDKDMWPKFFRWLIFGVCGSLLPLIVSFLILLIATGQPSLGSIMKNGELLLIVGGMSFIGIGELVGRGGKFPSVKIISAGASVLAAVTSLMLFIYIAYRREAIPSSPQANKMLESLGNDWIPTISIILFLISFLSCASCTILSGKDDNG